MSPADTSFAPVRSRTTASRIGPVVSAVAIAYAVFVLARLLAFGGDPSAFVVAGDGITDAAQAPPHLGINHRTDGYDGQAYYRLGRDPLTDQVTADGITFKRPAYWQARIGYPAAIWAVSGGGQASLVPPVMLLVNVAAVLALATLAAVLARDAGRSPWLALVPALWAGYVVGVGQDLTEPLAGAFLVAALLALRRECPVVAVAALTAAALTRETSLLVAIAVAATTAVPRLRRLLVDDPEERPTPPWWVGVAPLVVYAGWRAWVRDRWADVVPHPPGDNPLGVPLLQLGRYLAHAVGDPSATSGNLVVLLPTLLAIALVTSALGAGAANPHERLALAGYVVLLACLPVWDRDQAYLRWCCEPVLLGWVLLLGRRSVRLPLLLVTTCVLWLLVAGTTFSYPGPDDWTPAASPTPVTYGGPPGC